MGKTMFGKESLACLQFRWLNARELSHPNGLLCSFPPLVYPQKNKEQNRESPQRRTSVAKERQRNSNNRHDADHHPDIYQQVKQKYAHNTISIHASECSGLAFRQCDKPKYEHSKKHKN